MKAPLLTIKQAAERMGVSVPTVERWISAGKLPSCKLGGCRRLEPEDVEKFIHPGVVEMVGLQPSEDPITVREVTHAKP